jgi:hypothetical protein
MNLAYKKIASKMSNEDHNVLSMYDFYIPF